MINKIRISLIQFKYGIINLYNWFRVIWNDRDWDFYYVYNVLERKLKLMIDSGIYNQERDKHLKIAHKLLTRIKCSYYELEPLEVINYSLNCNELTCIVVNDMNEEGRKEYFKKYRRTIDKMRKEDPTREDDILMTLTSVEIQNKARRLFFKILNEKLEWWWD